MNWLIELLRSIFGNSQPTEGVPTSIAITTPVRKKTSKELRKELVKIARKDLGKTETGKNQGEWIKKFWAATSYPEGYKNKEPYCAAGGAYYIKEWLKLPEVLEAIGLTAEQAEKWRPKSARVFDWPTWAKQKGVKIIDKSAPVNTGDIVIYDYSHLEIATCEDGTTASKFNAYGVNTNASGSRDGEGAFEKPRNRSTVRCFIRILP